MARRLTLPAGQAPPRTTWFPSGRVAALVPALLCAALCACAPGGQRGTLAGIERPGAAGELWSIYVHDLATGERMEIGADELHHAASTMKILVLAKLHADAERGLYSFSDELAVHDEFPGALGGAFRTAAEDPAIAGALGGKLSIERLARAMIVSSDNLATNLLIERAGGPAAVTAHARELGCKQSSVARYIMDTRAFEAGLSSLVSARELGELLEKLVRGEVVSPRASSDLLALLGKSSSDWMGLRLPRGTTLAHKVGAIEGVRHDVGVLRLGDGHDVVICVLGSRLASEKAAEEAIAAFGKTIHDHALSWRTREGDQAGRAR